MQHDHAFMLSDSSDACVCNSHYGFIYNAGVPQGAMTKAPQPKVVPDLLGIWHLMLDDLLVQGMWFLTEPPFQSDHKVCPAVA